VDVPVPRAISHWLNGFGAVIVELDVPQAAVITHTGRHTTRKRNQLRRRNLIEEEKRGSI
jgi:hypothetical protein